MDTNRERLLQAMQLLTAAKTDLNQKAQPCQCCGLNVKENWSESQAVDTINGTIGKLQRLLNHEGLQPWLDRTQP